MLSMPFFHILFQQKETHASIEILYAHKKKNGVAVRFIKLYMIRKMKESKFVTSQ